MPKSIVANTFASWPHSKETCPLPSVVKSITSRWGVVSSLIPFETSPQLTIAQALLEFVSQKAGVSVVALHLFIAAILIFDLYHNDRASIGVQQWPEHWQQ